VLHSSAYRLGALFVVLVACDGGGGGRRAAAESVARIDHTGGLVSITAGPLRGLTIEVPAGAVQDPIEITVGDSFATAHPGTRPLARAAELSPLDVEFALPVRVTLPFDAASQSGNEIAVLARDAYGTIEEWVPTSIGEGTVTLEVARLSGLWPAERLFGGYATVAFTPVEPDNHWVLDNGITVRMAISAEEPNLEGIDVYRLVFDAEAPAATQGDFGLYFVLTEMGALAARGDFIDTGAASYQRLHAPGLLVPAAVTIGQPMVATHAVARTEPFGFIGTKPDGLAQTRLTVRIPEPVATPLGTFANVCTVRLDTMFLNAAGERTERWLEFTLAGGVGFVAVRDARGEGRLVSGVVGGRAIRRPTS
jgi:hypothetical protein